MLIANRINIVEHGCLVGTLCNELAKLEHSAKTDAARLFTLFRSWLGRQFAALGLEADADRLAVHVLMRCQGGATLATAFRDERFIRREVFDMEAWLKSGFNGGVFLLAGSLHPTAGGLILAHGESREPIEARVMADPFLA